MSFMDVLPERGQPEQGGHAQSGQQGQQRYPGRGRQPGQRAVRLLAIVAAQQPGQGIGLEEGATAEALGERRMAIAHVHQGQWPEDHEGTEPGHCNADETEGEEQGHGGSTSVVV
ncbi:hypothetical protein G6F62_014617 [Rhizopus arrhizus]|nr:hypothetical protein G6F62_014617 [Rhizopus arrhizus]